MSNGQKKIPKVKGVYTEINPICEALQIDCEQCDRATISIKYNATDPSFMYTLLLKEALLEIDDDDNKSIEILTAYCRENDIPENQIQRLEREYRVHTPIWWYTTPYFLYSTLNRGLRLMDVEIILKMGFFIRHLHQDIQKLHDEQRTKNIITDSPLKLYRGQGLSLEDFDKTNKSIGQLMSFNNFLSTSLNRNVSLNFAQQALKDSNKVGILFHMIIDPTICKKSQIPFADVSPVSYFKGKEAEILFTTHTIFRIDRIKQIDHEHTDRLWEVNLTLVGNDDQDLNELTTHVREEINSKAPRRGWSQLAFILLKVGEPAKAENIYKLLLRKELSDIERADYYHKLGWAYNNMGEYSKALSSHEQTLEIQQTALPPNHPDLARSYSNIGIVYKNMGEHSKALSSYERSLEIQNIALPSNHTDLASSYLGIGNVYYSMGEYSKALLSYERSLEIQKIALPPNHPDLATSYNNIGNIYDDMGEYSKALSSHERSLEIRKVALPPNHPDLAQSYLGIGNVYYRKGEYSKALSSYERSLEIKKIILPPNHPDVARSCGNIGFLYKKLGDYSKALTFLEKTHDIFKTSLPPNHPNVAKSKRDVENLKNNM
ncbi:unnamed protein product [Rotaria sp. Silwood2]|nr:unnamed protein product [Rotaria sp. Silwood2]